MLHSDYCHEILRFAQDDMKRATSIIIYKKTLQRLMIHAMP